MHSLVAMPLSTLEAVDIQPLNDVFKKVIVTVHLHGYYRVAVDPPTDLLALDYQQERLANCYFHLLDSDDMELALFDGVRKTDSLLLVAYARISEGNCFQTSLPFGQQFLNCSVLNLGFTEVQYASEESDMDDISIKKRNMSNNIDG